MEYERSKIKIVMLPWLAHGHVSPFLELAKRLIQRNFHIHFCSTPIILNSIKKKINQEQSLSIHLIEFTLLSLPNLPPHYHTTNGLPSHLMPVLKDALNLASPQFSKILDELKPNLIIYDYNQPWAPRMAKSRNIRAVEFLSFSASMMSFSFHMGKDPTVQFPYPEIMHRNFKEFVSRVHEPSSDERKREGYRFMESLKGSDLVLIKSFKELEGKFIDFFSSLVEKKVITTGPLVESLENDDSEKCEIMEWLDKKGKGSSVFVSFGSECFLTKEEIGEVAQGLELSMVNFLWLIRFPAGEKYSLTDVLPEGFLERVRERGKILSGWAPQLKILSHSSIGGFVSHCGWGSIMESMKLKVPIIPVPMHLDQPFNARLVENIGVGVEVGRAENGGLKGDEIAKAIRKVIPEKNGDELRRKVKEFGDVVSLKDETEIDGVVKELRELCKEGI